MNAIVGTHDILFITLDTLRYDVAMNAWSSGAIVHLAALLPPTGWELRHSPGSFTFAAHQAFFAGFLPTPALPGRHPRLFALAFPGSETTGPGTFVFDAPNLITGFTNLGYHTICIGGVGFFNLQTPLGRVLPGMFAESHWRSELGVTEANSTANQVDQLLQSLAAQPNDRRVFAFLNVSALHQPNCMYLPGATEDDTRTQAAALHYVDGQLGRLFSMIRRDRSWFVIICSDHGTAYGEDGYCGHRLAHPVVWNVPYADFLLEANG